MSSGDEQHHKETHKGVPLPAQKLRQTVYQTRKPISRPGPVWVLANGHRFRFALVPISLRNKETAQPQHLKLRF